MMEKLRQTRMMKWLHDRAGLCWFIIVVLVLVGIWWNGAFVANFAYKNWVARDISTPASPSNTPTMPPSGSPMSFGEAFTAIGALFAGLALGAVAFTLFLQQEETTHTRFREHFFQLLNAWQTATQGIRYKGAQGNDGFLKAENDLLGAYSGIERKFSEPGDLIGEAHQECGMLLEIDKVRGIYRRFYEQYAGGSLVYIFRLQYQILRTIHISRLPEVMRRDLARIYRSMLSDPELHLLLYFALSSYAARDYRDLITQYQLLDNLLFKEEQFIANRIPEIEHISLYSNWRDRRRQLIDGVIPS